MSVRNVYDFDKTIFDGDSTFRFYLYCARRYPRILLDVPAVALRFFGIRLGLLSKTRAKERMYRFLRHIPDVDATVSAFWAENERRIKRWYLQQRRDDDLIISASPTFLLSPVCNTLNVALLASRVDQHTGKTKGLNCHGEEKVERLRAFDPQCRIAAFYSDSRSDAPLARLAERAYLVRGNRIEPW